MIQLHNGDCLDIMTGIPDSSIDMVLTDPPYYKVKNEPWDRQWNKPEEFLKWLGQCVEQWHRILKPNGSLYCFASSQMAARVELLIVNYFNVNNHIVWAKQDTIVGGFFRKHKKEGLRCFAPASERIIFAEHYGADNMAKGESGYQSECDKPRGFVFEPISEYLKQERDKANWTNEDAKIAVGHSPKSGCHWFDKSQWCLPTKEIYETWQQKTNRFRREYEDLRRPFQVTAKVPYTDVWTFEPVRPYPGKHPCEKPQDLLYHIIKASTREEMTVLDCFMGTGSTGIACHDLNRKFIGIELKQSYFDAGLKNMRRATAKSAQTTLF